MYKLSSVLAIFLSAAFAQIPAGVNYKPASETINASARASLEAALQGGADFPKDLFGGPVACGPLLWNALEPTADKILRDAHPVIMLLSIPEPLQTQGRGFNGQKEQELFWSALLAHYPALKSAKARKATADEIKYFWTTIPFDIEEPLFAIDAGGDVFIANFTLEKGKPKLFWLDLVGDLHKLKPQSVK